MIFCKLAANSSRVGGFSSLSWGSGAPASSGLLTGHLLLKVSRLAEEAVPQNSSDAEFRGVEALPDTALGVVRQVLGVVHPVGAVVIPEMVILVVGFADR